MVVLYPLVYTCIHLYTLKSGMGSARVRKNAEKAPVSSCPFLNGFEISGIPGRPNEGGLHRRRLGFGAGMEVSVLDKMFSVCRGGRGTPAVLALALAWYPCAGVHACGAARLWRLSPIRLRFGVWGAYRPMAPARIRSRDGKESGRAGVRFSATYRAPLIVSFMCPDS